MEYGVSLESVKKALRKYRETNKKVLRNFIKTLEIQLGNCTQTVKNKTIANMSDVCL